VKYVLMGSLAAALAGAAHAADSGAGKSVYAGKCASCHGKDGKGNAAMAKGFKVEPAALDLTDDATLSKTDEELAAVTSKGAGKMPAYGGKLSEAEIVDVTAFMRTLGTTGKTGTTERTDKTETTEKTETTGTAKVEGAKVYAAKCASCHGKAGKGNPAMAKGFKVDPAALDLTDEATAAQADDALEAVTLKGKGKMPAFGEKLKAEEVEALLAYIRSLAPAKEGTEKEEGR
jgi:mono/diheme cytochrome c family protein